MFRHPDLQSLIWQIDKTQGYQGNDTLDFNLWSELKDDSIYIRNIHPIRGARELQSKNQYFLSNSLASKYSNVKVFNVFSELCPESQIFCTSEKYRDKTHLSSEGALSLYEGLLKKLN